ncbi:unnamed protein product, partial [Symbiodinium sp. KB8]
MPGDPPYPDLAATTTITVESVAPTASAPAPVTVHCTDDIPTSDINLITDEADNCDPNPTVTFVSDVSDGGSNPETITRTYRITDAAGNSLDVEQTITVAPFTIDTQPTNQTVVIGNNGSFTVSASNVDTYQWEVSTDGGSNFAPIIDGSEYSGTQTATLTVLSPDSNKDGYENQRPETDITVTWSILLFASLAVFLVGILMGSVEVLWMGKRFKSKSFGQKILYKMGFYILFMLLINLITFPIAASIESNSSLLDHQVWEKFANYISSTTFLSTMVSLSFSIFVSLIY